jgi:hypothetical protein
MVGWHCLTDDVGRKLCFGYLDLHMFTVTGNCSEVVIENKNLFLTDLPS